MLAEADEIFVDKVPCLTVVDGRSSVVLRLSPEEKRNGTTWGVTFLGLQEWGIELADPASDGARGIQAGATLAEVATPLGQILAGWQLFLRLKPPIESETVRQKRERLTSGQYPTVFVAMNFSDSTSKDSCQSNNEHLPGFYGFYSEARNG